MAPSGGVVGRVARVALELELFNLEAGDSVAPGFLSAIVSGCEGDVDGISSTVGGVNCSFFRGRGGIGAAVLAQNRRM